MPPLYSLEIEVQSLWTVCGFTVFRIRLCMWIRLGSLIKSLCFLLNPSKQQAIIIWSIIMLKPKNHSFTNQNFILPSDTQAYRNHKNFAEVLNGWSLTSTWHLADILSLLNHFRLFLYPLKTSAKLWFFDVFRSYRKRLVPWSKI